jgi:Histidine kinase-, DNA gyrase B-, and HSP90-like ATPase
MSITLNVLEHLGLNLYSSTPAVLSEAVANAWDANARRVDIVIDPGQQRIEITDDGDGMTEQEINDKFLTVGYHRRESNEPEATKNRLGRHVMGRKGIGKLSLFAIANSIEIHTIKAAPEGEDRERNAFVMRTDAIKASAEKKTDYHPQPLPLERIDIAAGTRIILTELDHKATRTAEFLRKRIARRFSIIGDDEFVVAVDGEPIGVEDRDYFPSIQYLWSIGDVADEYEKQAVNSEKRERLPGVVDAEKGWIVKGWVGTVKEHKRLEEGNDVVVLLAWGKLVQEDILKDSQSGGLFTKYLIGELRADFLDLDELADIATSDRQRLKETDDRYEAIRQWFGDEVMKAVGNSWRDWRNEGALDDALSDPGIREWYDSLAGADDRAAAKKLFGRIGTVMRDRESERVELYRHTILAFETLRIRRALSAIDELPDEPDIADFQKVFGGLDEVEAAEYHRIARGRLDVIERFRKIAPDQKEKIVQEFLFDHLWLLHPSWERPTSNKQIEQAVQTEWGKIDAKLTDEEKAGRIDIRYTTAAAKHVIVELKKASVSVNIYDLLKQMDKYRTALKKVLEEKFGEDDPHIEVVALVGKRPNAPSRNEQDNLLRSIDARMIAYDTLIQEALDSYRDYLEADERMSGLVAILDRVGAAVEAETESIETDLLTVGAGPDSSIG